MPDEETQELQPPAARRVAAATISLDQSSAQRIGLEAAGFTSLDAFLEQLQPKQTAEASEFLRLHLHEYVGRGVPVEQLCLVLELDRLADKALRLTMYLRHNPQSAN